jgi:hypothetical protein
MLSARRLGNISRVVRVISGLKGVVSTWLQSSRMTWRQYKEGLYQACDLVKQSIEIGVKMLTRQYIKVKTISFLFLFGPIILATRLNILCQECQHRVWNVSIASGMSTWSRHCKHGVRNDTIKSWMSALSLECQHGVCRTLENTIVTTNEPLQRTLQLLLILSTEDHSYDEELSKEQSSYYWWTLLSTLQLL